VLNYTAGVNISSVYNNGQVIITGQIEQPRKIPAITQTYAKISGVHTVTNATRISIPNLATRIYFPFAITDLQPTDLEKLVEVQAFLDMYPDYNIKILTKNDHLGDRAINQNLGQKRAQTVYNTLLKRGVKANRLQISGIIEISAESDSNPMSRWVEFQPTLKSKS
jgi:outer membrane protein OmpA-like peptidoglycan-associated protein